MASKVCSHGFLLDDRVLYPLNVLFSLSRHICNKGSNSALPGLQIVKQKAGNNSSIWGVFDNDRGFTLFIIYCCPWCGECLN